MRCRHAQTGLSALALAAVVALLAPTALADGGEERLLEAAIAIVASRVAPAVVRIDTLGELEEEFRAPRDSSAARGGVLARAGFKKAYGPSSGVIVSPGGQIVTSLFALQREPRHIIVTLSDGRQFVATVAGRDLSRGIALLTIEPEAPLPSIEVAPSHRLRAGRWCLAMGRGLGLGTVNLSLGILSAVNRVGGRALQSSALISPANYGGALLGLDGRVMGLIVALAPSGGQAGVDLYDSGIGFAIPMAEVLRSLPRLARGEVLEAGWLGVEVDRKRTRGGVTITKVVPRSPASRAGLSPGDLIKAIEGRALESYFELNFAIGARVAGDSVSLLVIRGGARRELEVELGVKPKGAPEAPVEERSAEVEPGHEGHDHPPGEHPEESPSPDDQGTGLAPEGVTWPREPSSALAGRFMAGERGGAAGRWARTSGAGVAARAGRPR